MAEARRPECQRRASPAVGAGGPRSPESGSPWGGSVRLTCPESRGAMSPGPEREADLSRDSGGTSLGPDCAAHLSRESRGALLVPEREADLSRELGG